MKYFAAFLPMRDPGKSAALRPQHLSFLADNEKEGRIFARGRFVDGTGGLVIYQSESLEAAMEVAMSDPYVTARARGLELHEWEMTTASSVKPAAGAG